MTGIRYAILMSPLRIVDFDMKIIETGFYEKPGRYL